MGLSAASVELVRNSSQFSMGVGQTFRGIISDFSGSFDGGCGIFHGCIYYFRQSSESFTRCFHIFQGSLYGIKRKYTVVPEIASVPNMRVAFTTYTEASTTSMGDCILPRKLSLLPSKLEPLPWKLVESLASIFVLFRCWQIPA